MGDGIQFQYVGASHQVPYQTEKTTLPAGQDLLVAFADEAEIPDFLTTGAIGFDGLGQGCLHSVRSFREGAPARIAAPRPLP